MATMKAVKGLSPTELKAALATAESQRDDAESRLIGVTGDAAQFKQDLAKVNSWLQRSYAENVRLQTDLRNMQARAEAAEGVLALTITQTEAAMVNARAVMASHGVEPEDAAEVLYRSVRARRLDAKRGRPDAPKYPVGE